MAKGHKDLGRASEKHIPGCVTRHVDTYVEDDNCSHRWHAAKKARAEKRIDYLKKNEHSDNRYHQNAENQKTSRGWLNEGKLSRLRNTAEEIQISFQPFAIVWWPWSHNAHHIIPRSTLAYTLDLASQEADPNHAEMFKFIVDSLLGEKYNLNDEPNMIILPLEEKDASRMKLPRHLEGTGEGAVDHPKYSAEVFDYVTGKIVEKYENLAKAFKAKKHQEEEQAPNVKDDLNQISDTTYNQIISVAQEAWDSGETEVTLDYISSFLFH